MTTNQLIDTLPKLHKDWDSGEPVFWGVDPEVIEFVEKNVSSGRTIETGGGFSSIGFIICGCTHTAVCPDTFVRDNILGFCDRHGN